jgi:hypothetical protein
MTVKELPLGGAVSQLEPVRVRKMMSTIKRTSETSSAVANIVLTLAIILA